MSAALRSLVIALLLCAMPGTAGGSSPGETTMTDSRPAHVLTAEYYRWAGGYAGPLRIMSRYASWSIGGDPAAVHAVGMKTYAYTDPNRTYAADNDYRIHDLLTQHPGAIAKNCAGATITTSQGKGILTDVRTPAALAHASALLKHVYTPGIDAVFMDDTSDVLYTDDGLPCGYAAGQWLDSTRAMYAAQPAPLIFNGLSMAQYGVDLLPLADLPNVVGAMWEGCYAFNGEWGVRGDGTSGIREHWIDIENSELAMAAKRKIFWCYNTARGTGAASTALRLYTYASFLLTYDARTSLYETEMTTPSGLRIFPETALVPRDPVIAMASDVAAFRTGTGVYVREYRKCAYRGVDVGNCAVAVNPEALPHDLTLNQYRHTVALRGGGVLDGGSLSTLGDPAPPTLAPHSAVIEIR